MNADIFINPGETLAWHLCSEVYCRLVLKSGHVELTDILFQIHRAVSVYLHKTVPLIVPCSSDSWKAYENVGGTSMNVK